MRLTTAQWMKIQQAKDNGTLTELICNMLEEARQLGVDDVLDDPQAYDLVSSDRGGN